MIELLAPAGNLEKLKIAIHYGANAVYVAGGEFGLRSAADNFSTQQLSDAVNYAHRYGSRIYIALNALLHNHEIKKLPEYLNFLETIQPDALICADLGVVDLVKQHTSIPVHLSTQTSVLNSWHARVWKQHGVKRIVVARELSIQQAAEIKEKTGLEIEMFVHGAMCVSYSGYCTISNYTAGRDSNRGGCLQNCRHKYGISHGDSEPKDAYFLSSKDLNGMEHLNEFLACGIDSIKIEGRMKSNLYIASTVRAYSQALLEISGNQTQQVEFWREELKKIPHRDYTDASLEGELDRASIYDESEQRESEYCMAGTVLTVDPGKNRFSFLTKQKLSLGDTVEIMPYKGPVLPVEVKILIDLSGKKREFVQPDCAVWLPWQKNISPHNVGRVRSQ